MFIFWESETTIQASKRKTLHGVQPDKKTLGFLQYFGSHVQGFPCIPCHFVSGEGPGDEFEN